MSNLFTQKYSTDWNICITISTKPGEFLKKALAQQWGKKRSVVIVFKL